ncbi:hypothetical protein M0R45_021175 [Rubus argutus]|uniref:Pectinesterase inhibitor domain-containing protein n=1 Tax=Rubus argutus TaxID=59490 RepID=A0AAW1XC82_RUBAR
MKSNSISVAGLLFLVQLYICVSSNKPWQDPRSSDTDVTGLALIMVEVVKAKATECANKINDLLKRSPGDQSLSSCKDKYYSAVINADIPSANEALTKGDPKFAEQGINYSAAEAKSCENGFSGGSPMTDLNKAAHLVATVATEIMRT